MTEPGDPGPRRLKFEAHRIVLTTVLSAVNGVVVGLVAYDAVPALWKLAVGQEPALWVVLTLVIPLSLAGGAATGLYVYNGTGPILRILSSEGFTYCRQVLSLLCQMIVAVVVVKVVARVAFHLTRDANLGVSLGAIAGAVTLTSLLAFHVVYRGYRRLRYLDQMGGKEQL